MNKWIVVGNLTQDPEELKHTGDGTPLCKFRLAVNKYSKGKESKANFFRFTCWGKTAETVHEYLKKGSKVLIEARVDNDNYEKDGETIFNDTYTAERVNFLDSKHKED